MVTETDFFLWLLKNEFNSENILLSFVKMVNILIGNGNIKGRMEKYKKNNLLISNLINEKK